MCTKENAVLLYNNLISVHPFITRGCSVAITVGTPDITSKSNMAASVRKVSGKDAQTCSRERGTYTHTLEKDAKYIYLH